MGKLAAYRKIWRSLVYALGTTLGTKRTKYICIQMSIHVQHLGAQRIISLQMLHYVRYFRLVSLFPFSLNKDGGSESFPGEMDLTIAANFYSQFVSYPTYNVKQNIRFCQLNMKAWYGKKLVVLSAPMKLLHRKEPGLQNNVSLFFIRSLLVLWTRYLHIWVKKCRNTNTKEGRN